MRTVRLLLAIAFLAIFTGAVQAAPRLVLGEMFTNTS
jgi:hypothetical protein